MYHRTPTLPKVLPPGTKHLKLFKNIKACLQLYTDLTIRPKQITTTGYNYPTNRIEQ